MVSTHPMERGNETLIDPDPPNGTVGNIEQPVFEAIAQTAHDSDVQEVKRPADKKPPTNRSTRYRTTKSETPLMPAEYKTLTLKLPAAAWERILAWLDTDQWETVSGHVKCQDVSIDRRSIKNAISAGLNVPGADLAIGKTSLRRS